ALTKINKKSPHAADQKMVLATHRVAPTTSGNCSRLYLRGLSSVTRTGEPSSKELAARTRFASVQASVNTRAKNLATLAQDQAAFLAQKDVAGGCKTFKSWLWKVEGEAYDENHQ
ncbi:MAG: hypothetical protein IJQ84_10190, partial [Paludibacteraceae bacterium]|nr:hypothetical protein [Paludibacteraceae bacterium]